MEHDKQECYGDALSEANRWQGRNPHFAATLRAGGPTADELRAKFLRCPAVACFVKRSPKNAPGSVEVVQHLADEAEAWQDGGQFTAISAMWDRWRTKGVLDDLSRNDRAVLQALVMMAMLTGGPQVIASLHYVRVIVEVQFGVRISHETVRASYRRLERRHLLEVLRGTPGCSRRSSTCVDFRCSLEPMPGSPSDEALTDLTMLPETIAAASAYRVEAYAARAVAQRQLEKASTDHGLDGESREQCPSSTDEKESARSPVLSGHVRRQQV